MIMGRKSQVTEDNEGFAQVLLEAQELHDRKNRSYNGAWRIGGVQALAENLMRKIRRIDTTINVSASTEDGESFRDTLMDNAIYSLMMIQLLDEKSEVKELPRCPHCGKLMEK
jgi:hypothetical protein